MVEIRLFFIIRGDLTAFTRINRKCLCYCMQEKTRHPAVSDSVNLKLKNPRT